jgi:spore coat polysaccharide biosynthesis protein SpsF
VTCAVVVQARMASTRLPGKSLLELGDSTLLQHILRRLKRIEAPVALLVATSAEPEDDAIQAACRDEEVAVYRGAADDVLDRFAAAVEELDPRPEVVLRVCADRPLVCSRLADELIAAYEPAGSPDYLSNALVKSYPDGYDLELVRTEALLLAAKAAVDPYEREHVTPYVYRRPERFSLVNLTCPYGDFSRVRATIDYAEDYESLRRVVDRLGADHDWRDALTLAELEPELFP